MNATTINTFPPFQSMTSPRGWILAAIVLLHVGFFLALSSGMSLDIVKVFRTSTTLVTPPVVIDIEPPQPVKSTEIEIDRPRLFVPEPLLPPSQEDAPTAPVESITSIPPAPTPIQHPGTAEPVTTMPEIDPRLGLSEPLYPASEIRAEHTGTVLLSVYVLENGRIGDVRLDRSSGYSKLDDSALREARRWRLKPGMRDGVPVAMWKQIPVTFQLQSGGSRRF